MREADSRSIDALLDKYASLVSQARRDIVKIQAFADCYGARLPKEVEGQRLQEEIPRRYTNKQTKGVPA